MAEVKREHYLELYEGGQDEIVEKKSRFIAVFKPVNAEEEAVRFIEENRKKYWDARHHCSAFVIGRNNEITRCSDDGEPSGTAGRPMLDVLLGEGIHNCCVVVIRYFGGTLLGTGGLVRAYSAAVKAGLLKSVVLDKIPGKKVTVGCDYTGVGKLQYIAAQMGLTILDTQYTDAVEATIMVPDELVGSFEKKMTEASSGRAKILVGDPCYFAELEGEVFLFEE